LALTFFFFFVVLSQDAPHRFCISGLEAPIGIFFPQPLGDLAILYLFSVFRVLFLRSSCPLLLRFKTEFTSLVFQDKLASASCSTFQRRYPWPFGSRVQSDFLPPHFPFSASDDVLIRSFLFFTLPRMIKAASLSNFHFGQVMYG